MQQEEWPTLTPTDSPITEAQKPRKGTRPRQELQKPIESWGPKERKTPQNYRELFQSHGKDKREVGVPCHFRSKQQGTDRGLEGKDD